MIKILAWCIAVSLIVLPGINWAEVQCPNFNRDIPVGEKPLFMKKLARSVFQVIIVKNNQPRLEETIGTATLVSDDGYLLTAKHIFDIDEKRIRRGIKSGEYTLAVRISRDTSNHVVYDTSILDVNKNNMLDVALLKINNWSESGRYNLVHLDPKTRANTNDVRLMGYLLNDQIPSASEKGTVQRESIIDGYLRVTGLSAYQGYSGGLLISQYGRGIGVLSGRFKEDEPEKWDVIDDQYNGALNVVPIFGVLGSFSKMDIKETMKFIRKLKGSSRTIKPYEISDFMEQNPFEAMLFALRIVNEPNLIGLGNRTNIYNVLELIGCLMPSSYKEEAFHKLIAQNDMDSVEKEWISTEVSRKSLDNARELYKRYLINKDEDILKESLEEYALAMEAMPESKDIHNNKYIASAKFDYYKAAKAAKLTNNKVFEIEKIPNPNTILSEAVMAIKNNANKKSNTYSIVWSAAASELTKRRRYEEGAYAAAMALKSDTKNISAYEKDWAYIIKKAAMHAKTESKRVELESQSIRAMILDENAPKISQVLINRNAITKPGKMELNSVIMTLTKN